MPGAGPFGAALRAFCGPALFRGRRLVSSSTSSRGLDLPSAVLVGSDNRLLAQLACLLLPPQKLYQVALTATLPISRMQTTDGGTSVHISAQIGQLTYRSQMGLGNEIRHRVALRRLWAPEGGWQAPAGRVRGRCTRPLVWVCCPTLGGIAAVAWWRREPEGVPVCIRSAEKTNPSPSRCSPRPDDSQSSPRISAGAALAHRASVVLNGPTEVRGVYDPGEAQPGRPDPDPVGRSPAPLAPPLLQPGLPRRPPGGFVGWSACPYGRRMDTAH